MYVSISEYKNIFILSSSKTKPSVRLLLLEKFYRLYVDRNIHLQNQYKFVNDLEKNK